MSDLTQQQFIVENYLEQGRYELSAFSFVNIFAWADFFRFEFLEMDGCLCVFAHQDIGCFQYLPPLGERVTPEIIARCFDHMWKINGDSSLTRIENVPEEMLELFDRRLYVSRVKSRDYCYHRRDIAEMKGLKFSSQRWMWNHFCKHHAYTFEPYQARDAAACAELYDVWAEDRRRRHADEIYQSMIEENRIVHQRVLKHFDRLGLVGRVIRIDGCVRGYTFGYPVSSRVFCDLFEITDLSLKGLSSVIFRELCRDPQVQGYEIINVMDDFGMPNIQKTKMNFNPRFFVPSYTVSLR